MSKNFVARLFLGNRRMLSKKILFLMAIVLVSGILVMASANRNQMDNMIQSHENSDYDNSDLSKDCDRNSKDSHNGRGEDENLGYYENNSDGDSDYNLNDKKDNSIFNNINSFLNLIAGNKLAILFVVFTGFIFIGAVVPFSIMAIHKPGKNTKNGGQITPSNNILRKNSSKLKKIHCLFFMTLN